MTEPATTEAAGSTPANTGTPGKRTPSERARLAALARWGKYKGKGKAKGGARKPKTAADEKETARRQEAADNRTATLADLDVSEDAQAAMEALAAGNVPTDSSELEAMGLAERDKSGAVRLTPAGRAAYNAASRGEKGQLKEALSRGRDAAITAKEKAEAEIAKEAEAAAKPEATPKGGGGGGGGAAKPTPEDKAKAKAETRAKTAADTAERVKLPGLDTLRQARDEGGVDDPDLRALGLVGADGLTTDQGRRALTALENGNVGQYRAALQDAAGRMQREAAAAQRAVDTALRAAERAAEDAERDAAREARIRRDERRKLLREMGETQKAMSDTPTDTIFTVCLDGLTDIVEALAPDATKAGKRHSTADQVMLDAICEAAWRIHKLAEELGAVPADDADADDEPDDDMDDGAPEDMTAIPGAVKMIGDEIVAAGDAVKALGDGMTMGYLVKFSDPERSAGDLTPYRDLFLPPPHTDYGSAKSSDVYVHHRQLPGLGKRQLRNAAEIGFDDVGVFVKHLLDLRDPYEKALYGLAQQGKLGWSSGTAPHLVERKALGDGRHVIEKWPLGLDASYTPTPAGGLDMTTAALKALVEIDSPEANDPDPVEADPDPAVKTAADARAQRLLLTLDFLALETA